MTWTAQDYHFMSHAIHLARRGRYTCDPNPRVGCVISKDNQLLAEGWHQRAGEEHAEINALKQCDNPKGTTVYVTLEPCCHEGKTPPCLNALIDAEVKEVIVAMVDPNPEVAGNGLKQLEAAGINVKQGLLENEARELNSGFIKRMETGFPYVRCKMAMSLDGKTALANGESQWITGEAARRDVHKFRAASSAILSSAETIIKDNAALNVRDIDFDFKQPLRVIIDRQLRVKESAKLFEVPGDVIIYTECEDKNHPLADVDATIISMPPSNEWLSDVLSHLANNYETNEVMVEAGAAFSGALIDAGLVDELIVYIAPKLLGHDAAPLLKLQNITNMDNALQFEICDVRQTGGDLRLTLKPGDV